MKKIHKILIFLIIILIIFAITLYDYKIPDKQVILSNNAEEVLNAEENSILDLIQDGNNYLLSGDFENAKKSYELAISRNISNEKTYTEIKNSYINANRFDDAYYIIKLAIDNNISKDAFKLTLEEIQSKFEVTIVNNTIIQYSNFILPTKIEIPINNTSTLANIRWENNSNIDTSNPGEFSFKGYADEYGRTVTYNLSIKEKPAPVIKTQIGYINNYSEKDGNIYISFDEVEFFTGTKADEEAIKDNNLNALGIDGRVYDGYYLRNNLNKNKSYILSPNSEIKVCKYCLDPFGANGANLQNISIAQLKTLIDSDSRLFWITTEDDIIVSAKMQYIP